MTRSMIPKVCSANHKWSANHYTNQYVELRRALKCFKWSTHQKSLGTTELDNTMNLNWISNVRFNVLSFESLLVFGQKQNIKQFCFSSARVSSDYIVVQV